jgi:hypothetical protein
MTAAVKISDRPPVVKDITPDGGGASAHRELPATSPDFNHAYHAMIAHNGKDAGQTLDPNSHNKFTITGTEGDPSHRTGTQTVAQNTETTTETSKLSGSYTYQNPDTANPNFSTVGNDQLKTVNYTADGRATTNTTNTETTQLASNDTAPTKPAASIPHQPDDTPDPRTLNMA